MCPTTAFCFFEALLLLCALGPAEVTPTCILLLLPLDRLLWLWPSMWLFEAERRAERQQAHEEGAPFAVVLKEQWEARKREMELAKSQKQ